MSDHEKRWELYLWAMGPELAMPREVFDAIATQRPDLGIYGMHRVWQTPSYQVDEAAASYGARYEQGDK